MLGPAPLRRRRATGAPRGGALLPRPDAGSAAHPLPARPVLSPRVRLPNPLLPRPGSTSRRTPQTPLVPLPPVVLGVARLAVARVRPKRRNGAGRLGQTNRQPMCRPPAARLCLALSLAAPVRRASTAASQATSRWLVPTHRPATSARRPGTPRFSFRSARSRRRS